MKKLLFILILIFSYLQSFTCEKDSIFDIRLQHDSLADNFNVVFNNITNDTVMLQKYFKDHLTESKNTLGFSVTFFDNNRQFMPNWGELPKQDYKIENGRKEGKNNIYVASQEEVILTIQLPFGLLIKSIREKKRKRSDNLCIILKLYYMCFIIKEKRAEMNYFESDCFEIKL